MSLTSTGQPENMEGLFWMVLLASPIDMQNTSPTGLHLRCARTRIPEMRLKVNGIPRQDINDSPASGGYLSIFIAAW